MVAFFRFGLCKMKSKVLVFLSLLPVLCVPALSGCSSAKESLGLNKKAPDEFQVLKRAPLEMPPDYALRPPVPGAPRPQEQATAEAAAQTVFGQKPAAIKAATAGEGALLQQAGASGADPSIRAQIDAETAELNESNVPVVKKLMTLGGAKGEAPASVVDAKAEAERLKKNAEDGKPVTDGETPTVEE